MSANEISEEKIEKKPYVAPRLTEWGELRNITKGSTGSFADTDSTELPDG